MNEREPTRNEYKCARCRHIFATLTLFDSHQAVNYHAMPAVMCRTPQSMGLVQSPRGTWCTPEGLAARESARTRLAAARSKGG